MDMVAPGAIIQGNRRDPNDWQYDITRVNRARSICSKSGISSWSDGWNVELGQPNWVTGPYSWTQSAPSSANLPDLTSTVNRLVSLADAEALEKLWEKVRGSLDLSIDSFERRKTLEMINLLPRFKKAILQAPLGGRRITPTSTLKSLGNAWLEWTYGWMPLASSIHGIAEELTRYEVNRIRKFNARNTQSETSTRHITWTGLNGTFDGKAVCNAEAKVRYVCSFEVDNFDTKRITSLNPASIAWELMPYSFVVDWFYDVGSYMRSFESALLYNRQFVGGYKSILMTSRASCSASNAQLSAYGEPMIDNCTLHEEEHISFRRVVLYSVPFPSAPVLKIDLGASRLLSAASLLSQFLRG
ncbi:TPA_asm: maturation protein [ssRNA phage ESE058]|uniref:Maturation protein n=1 Tax=ssRNA phage ESE058 TaxID=2786006 RepID=A0A8S5KXI2_9VIRU|nr:maturation protein [ssRNA phage ESE058]DAD49912.1 TPA_asm: maturation protein [ssRNA phage ESE058]